MSSESMTPGLSFRLRLTLSVLALALVPLLVLGVVAITQLRGVLVEQVNGRLASDAENLHEVLDATVQERTKNVQSWAEDSIIRGALLYNSYEKSDASLAVLHERYPQYGALVLFTPDGPAVSASDPKLRDRYAEHAGAVAQTSWFRAALPHTTSEPSLRRAALCSSPAVIAT